MALYSVLCCAIVFVITPSLTTCAVLPLLSVPQAVCSVASVSRTNCKSDIPRILCGTGKLHGYEYLCLLVMVT